MRFLREVLERPANERAYVVIPIGYAAHDAEVPTSNASASTHSRRGSDPDLSTFPMAIAEARPRAQSGSSMHGPATFLAQSPLQHATTKRIGSRAQFSWRGVDASHHLVIRLTSTEKLPTLWYPQCAKCGQKATPRAGLGDERGPHPVPHDVVTCAACGHKTQIDERTLWLRELLEEAP